MKKSTPDIRNSANEKIDTWVEEPESRIKANVIMVHGFGTSKHETAGYFNDVAKFLVENGYRVIRFDLSGYGNSEGRQEEACYSKHTGDVHVVVDWVKENFSEPICMIAQSMGCWITALAAPEGVKKTIMTGIPNANIQIVLERFKLRFGSRPGAVLNMKGISLLPRSTGKIQKLGPQFWLDMKNFKPIGEVKKYAQKTNLMIIHWKNDEIIGLDNIDEYDKLSGVKALYLNGDHSVTDPIDRKNFMKIMLEYFND